MTGEAEPEEETEIGKGVGSKTGTAYSGTASNDGESVTFDVYVDNGKITGIFIVQEDGEWLNLLTAIQDNFLGKSAKKSTVDAVTSATSLGFRDAIRDAISDAVSKIETPVVVPPTIIAGANGSWTKGSQTGLSFTSDAEYSAFKSAKVDGSAVSSGSYTVSSGSTVVTLNASYLETLSAGEHSLAIVSENGSAATTFTVGAAETDDSGRDDTVTTGIADGTYTATGKIKLYSYEYDVTVTVTVSGGKITGITATPSGNTASKDEYCLDNAVYSLNNTLKGQEASADTVNAATFSSSGVPYSAWASSSGTAFNNIKALAAQALGSAGSGSGSSSGSDAGKTISAGGSATIYVGETVTLNGTKPSSYTFLGWNADPEATEADEAYSAKARISIDADLTLYAVWEQKTFVLIYDANAGEDAVSGMPDPARMENATGSFTVTEAAPTREGYTFLGWADDAGATTAVYENGDTLTVERDATTDEAEKTIYAVWQANRKVTYGVDGVAPEGFTVPVDGNTYTVKPKMVQPTVDKQVYDNNDEAGQAGDNNGWGETADHAINESFQFRLVATIPADSEAGYNRYDDYPAYTLKFHDTMSAGVTFEGIDSVYVGETVIPAFDGEQQPKGYSLSEIETGDDGKQTWTLTIPDVKAFNDLANGATVTVTYNAHLNGKAIVHTESATGAVTNSNGVYLEYSNNPNTDHTDETGKTTEDTVWVFTYGVNNTKVDDANNPLANAGFRLYTEIEENEVEIPLVYDDTINAYRRAASGESSVEMMSAAETGVFNIVGLDAGTYVLKETTTPGGYNTCDPVTITIQAIHTENTTEKGGADLTLNGTNTSNEIVNHSGSTLPSTGGPGTGYFTAIGSALLLFAAAMLVARARRRKI